MKRQIIRIDEERCTGCGLCVTGCPEGALQVIDGKARLVGEILCDGLGACIGTCPEEAIEVETREAEPYDERLVMDNILEQGPNVLKAHLQHLKDHGQDEYLAIAREVLKERGVMDPTLVPRPERQETLGCGCPGSAARSFDKSAAPETSGPAPSRLGHWPVQLHLVGPTMPAYRDADVVLAADCTAYAMGDFHERFIKNKAIAIACPKLDQGQEIYLDKLTAMIDEAEIRSLTVVIMQVPCCGGLQRLAEAAIDRARRKIPLRLVVVGVQGDILSDDS